MGREQLRRDALRIIEEAFRLSRPDEAVRRAFEKISPGRGKIILVAVGKAAWQMAKTAADCLGDRYEKGYVITKYGHFKGEIPRIEIMEAGHPVVDDNSVKATETVLEAVQSLSSEDQVLFLLSGGGSALFEKPKIPLEELKKINQSLLACGADIGEINQIRKRLSMVKGGRFAKLCEPARVTAIILSDVVGDHPEMIASGPAYPDSASEEEVLEIIKKYDLSFSETVMKALKEDPVTTLNHVETYVTGGVGQLCRSAAQLCRKAGYETEILTDTLTCEAREAGSFLGSVAAFQVKKGVRKAFVAGGETIVHLKGTGKGGRNQEIALAAAEEIAGLERVVVASASSDGTDGPTDAAGGIVDGTTRECLKEKGISIFETLKRNDSYHALQAADGLILTGPTGTNVNDVALILIAEE